MGITILFANILEFAWQSIGIGTAVAGSGQNILVYGLAVILWTTLGTATLWGPALAFMFAPQWATERFERLTTKIPTVKPWQVALPLAFVRAAVRRSTDLDGDARLTFGRRLRTRTQEPRPPSGDRGSLWLASRMA